MPWKPPSQASQTSWNRYPWDPGWEASREAQTTKKRLSRKKCKSSVYTRLPESKRTEQWRKPAARGFVDGLGQNRKLRFSRFPAGFQGPGKAGGKPWGAIPRALGTASQDPGNRPGTPYS